MNTPEGEVAGTVVGGGGEEANPLHLDPLQQVKVHETNLPE